LRELLKSRPDRDARSDPVLWHDGRGSGWTVRWRMAEFRWLQQSTVDWFVCGPRL